MFWRRRRTDEDFASEIDAHLESEVERLVDEGLTRDDAIVQARRMFGNITRARERFFEARRLIIFEQFKQDLRYAWRGLWHSRAFVASTVLTLAVGMGLVTVVFAVFSAYVLRPFAVHDPTALHEVQWWAQEAGGSTFRWRDYEELKARTDLFDGTIAESRRSVASNDRQMSVGFVSGDYFETLGARVALGRSLMSPDARVSGSEPVVLLTDHTWALLFDRDPAVVGREIELNGRPLLVVGVMAPEFAGMDEVPRDAWVPITMLSTLLGGSELTTSNDRSVRITVRLRHDVTAQQAQSAIALEPFETRVTGRFDPVRAELQRQATPVRMTRGQFTVLSPIFAAFALVLIAACANASNVMLARAGARQREIGIRLSIGASRGRVVRQLMTEGLVIAAMAAVLGLALASLLRRLGTYFFAAILPPTVAARVRFVPFDFDYRVIIFAMIVACAVTILFALLPALQATRMSLTDALRGQLTGAIRSGTLRGLLVTSQVTVSLVLLIVAATLVRNGSLVRATNLGMETAGVVSVRGGTNSGLVRRAHEELSADPRVGLIAVASRAPLFGMPPPAPVRRPSGVIVASYAFVSPEYFDVLRIPIVRGRLFTRQESKTEAAVAIVSAAGARALWPGEDPIGKTVRVPLEPVGQRVVADTVKSMRGLQEVEAGATEFTIVGVAQDVVNGFVYQGLDPAHFYLPTSVGGARVSTVILKGRGALDAGGVRSILSRITLDPLAFDVLPLDEVVSLQMFPLRVASWIGTLLSAVALVLSISGLYGVLAYTFGQRVREIGVRMALGASAGRIRRLVFRQAARFSIVGLSLGLLVSFTVMKLLSTVIRLDNVSVLDPVAFLASFVLICLAVVLASYGPARRAARVDPSSMLRADA
jgi:predicted permease